MVLQSLSMSQAVLQFPAGYYSYGDKVHGHMVTNRVWNYGYGLYGTMVTAF